MLIRSPKLPAPPAQFLVLLVAAAFLLSACTAPPGTPTSSPVAFHTPTTAGTTGVQALCEQATALTTEGYPQQAVAVIDQYNDTLVATDTQACLPERASALARMAAAERLAQAAVSHAMTQSPMTIPPPTTETCVLDAEKDTELLSRAFTCDRENATAVALNGKLKESAVATEPSAWTEFTTKNVAPWQELTIAFLLWLAVSVVVAQLLPLLTRNYLPPHAPPPIGAVGMLLIAAGATVGTFGVVMHDTWKTWAAQTHAVPVAGPATFAVGWLERVAGNGAAVYGSGWYMVVGAGITAVGLLLWDWRRRSTKKLLVTVNGDDGETSVDNLRGIISDMGSANPRGVEMPVGPDLTFLKDVDFTTFGVGGWANAVKSFMLAIKPHVPWNLAVSVVSDDRLAVTLRHNHQQVASEIIDRAWLKLDAGSLADLDKDAPPTEKLPAGEEAEEAQLWPFPAALALCEMARTSPSRLGLSGATNWRGVALQHLATSQLRRRRAVSRALLGSALDLDPNSRAASLAYWSALYRDSSDTHELERYVNLLRGLIEKVCEWPDAKSKPKPPRKARREPAILLRAYYSLIATQINLEKPTEAAADLEHLNALVDWLTPKKPRARWWLAYAAEFGFDRAYGAQELASTMSPLVRDLGRMVPGTPPPEEEAEGTGGPLRHYSQACVVRTNPETAVRLLKLADRDPDLAAWRTLDPQLKSLHHEVKYREAFGDEVPTDLHTIEPFASYKDILRPAGLTTAAKFANFDWQKLQSQLDIPERIAARMVRLADFTRTLEATGLGEWAIPLTDLLGKNEIQTLSSKPPLFREARSAVETFRKRPTDDQLKAVFAEGEAPKDPPAIEPFKDLAAVLERVHQLPMD